MRFIMTIRRIKMFGNITLADFGDITGVSIFVKEVIGAGVIVLIVVAAVITIGKAYRKRKKEKDEGPPQPEHHGGPHHLVKAIFRLSPCCAS